MIKNLLAIETALGLKAGEFKAFMDDAAEKEIDLSNIEINKKDELATRINNLKIEAGTAAVEIAIKNVRKDLGLTFEGKTMDKFTEAFKTKILEDAKIAPDAKVKELEKDLGLMRTNFETEKTKREKIEGEFQQKETLRTIRESVMAKIPANTVIPKEDVLNLFVSKNEIELSENKLVFKKNGEVLKNKSTLNPLTIDEIMPEFITPYVKVAEGGGGGTDTPTQAKEGSFDKFAEEMFNSGIKENTPKFNDEMQKRIKAGTLKV